MKNNSHSILLQLIPKGCHSDTSNNKGEETGLKVKFSKSKKL